MRGRENNVGVGVESRVESRDVMHERDIAMCEMKQEKRKT